jgi:Ca-activated chloride channel family protein
MARHTSVALFAVVLALSLLAVDGAPVSAQQGVFRTSVQTVPIFATVVDQQGRLVPDLTQEDFEIFDDNKKQTITLFKSDVQPVSVVVMLDTSGSMTANLEFVKNAAEKFVIRLLPDDRARIGSFSDKITLSPRFTSNRDELVRYLHTSIDFGNPTALWDAGWASLEALKDETNRRVVLLFTDGDDNASRRGLGDVMRRAQAEDYMVYGVGLRSVINRQETRPDSGLKRIATETGGGYFEMNKTEELNATFSRVADELHRQYVLGFTPTLLDGKDHKLNVVVKRAGMTARARKSYVATRKQ